MNLAPCPIWIGGEWPHLSDQPTTPVQNPSTGALHMQGKESVQFFTQLKVTMSRWFSYGEGDVWYRESKC
jgi:hypothetical protein